MGQWSTILRLRRALLTNRWAAVTAKQRLRLAALGIVSVIFLLGGGHLAAPLLMESPLDLATPRGLSADELPAGAGALESAFWLSALIAAVLNFRVLELLFRREDVVALQPLPIEAPAFFLDRFGAALTEALLCALATTLFFAPLLWHSGSAAFAASAAMLFGGLILGTAISMMVMLAATRQLIPDDKTSPNEASPRPASDAYGGPGQLLLYAPALSLGAIVVLLLFWKLLVGEPLRLGRLSDPFLVGTAIQIVIGTAAVIYAFQTFRDAYFDMAPRFHDADNADYSALIDYQTSSFEQPRRWEVGLGRHRSILRAILIDDDRRMAGSRVGHAVVLFLAMLGLLFFDLDVLPAWAVGLVPATLLTLFINPWSRLSGRSATLNEGLALPIEPAGRHRVLSRLALREALFVALPFAIAILVILGWWRGQGMEAVEVSLFALACTPAICTLMILTLPRARGIALYWFPLFFLALFAALSVASLLAATVTAITLFLAYPVLERSLAHG